MRDYQVVRTYEEVDALVKELEDGPDVVAFDLETGYVSAETVDKRALNTRHPDFIVVGFSITNSKNWARYVPLRHDNDRPLEPIKVWEKFRKVFETKEIIAHNASFERAALASLYRAGDVERPLEMKRVGHDTMIMANVLGKYKEVGLKALTREVLGESQTEYASLFGAEVMDKTGTKIVSSKVKKTRFNSLPVSPEVVNYGCDDSALCMELFEVFYPQLDETLKRIYSVEMQILLLMSQAEEFGVGVDWAGIQEAHNQYLTFRPKFETKVREEFAAMTVDPELKELARHANFGSPKQMRALLYEGLGMKTTRTSGSGEMSTDAKALEALSRKHVAVRSLLSLREIDNLGRRLKKWLDEYSDCFDGRVHPSFNQVRVISGRFAASEPAIQQLGKDWLWSINTEIGEDGKVKFIPEGTNGEDYWTGNFRKFIIAGENKTLCTFDYSAQEVRVMTGLTQEPSLMKGFAKGDDPHKTTAALIYNKPYSQVTKSERQAAKFCIAEGQMVLTDTGLVPIEQVSLDHKVWDGVEWVSHTGVVYQGERDVISYQGLSATPDHLVYLEDGRKVCWGYVVNVGRDCIAERDSRETTRLLDSRWTNVLCFSDFFNRKSPKQEKVSGKLYSLWQAVRKVCGKLTSKQRADLYLHESSEVWKRSTSKYSGQTLRRSSSEVSPWYVMGSQLWRQRYSDEVRESYSLHRVDSRESTTRVLQGCGNRQDRQRWALRTWKHSVVQQSAKYVEQTEHYSCAVHGAAGCPASRVALDEDRSSRFGFFSKMDGTLDRERKYARANTANEALWSRQSVYDLTNAGHRNRFTVSGYVVSNCTFGIAYGMGAKSLAEQLAVSKDEAQDIIDTYKSRLSKVGQWDAQSRRQGVADGFVTSWFGRKMTLWAASNPDPYIRSGAERLAVNAQIQGGAADYTKLAMIRAWALLKQAGLWGTDKVMLTMNQHDSLTFEVSDDLDMNKVRDILQEAVVFDARKMFPKLQIPVFPRFDVDWELGKTWGGSIPWPLEEKATKTETGWAVGSQEDTLEVQAWSKDETVDTPQVQVVHLVPEALQVVWTGKVDKARLQAFTDMLKSNSGDTVVYFTMKGQTKKLATKTALSGLDANRISFVLGGAEVHERTIEEMEEML